VPDKFKKCLEGWPVREKSLLRDKTMEKFRSFLNTMVDGFVILLITSMVIVVFAQVFFRYVVMSSPPWTEEFSRFNFIWLTFMGGRCRFQTEGTLGHRYTGRSSSEEGCTILGSSCPGTDLGRFANSYLSRDHSLPQWVADKGFNHEPSFDFCLRRNTPQCFADAYLSVLLDI